MDNFIRIPRSSPSYRRSDFEEGKEMNRKLAEEYISKCDEDIQHLDKREAILAFAKWLDEKSGEQTDD